MSHQTPRCNDSSGPRFGRAEVLFATAVIGLAVTVGAVRMPRDVAYGILIVLWSALIGLMIPQLRARRSPSPGQSPGGAAIDTGTARHDIAAALLTIEGGVTAMRYMNRGGESDRAESIAHAIEIEIRRIRRLSASMRSSIPTCDLVDTLEPVIRLHQVNGLSIACELDAPGSVAIAGDDLARAVANLLENCAVHAPGADVVIRGRASGDRYTLVVADDGPGIDPQLRADVGRFGASTRRGGGLGLYSVRSIVEAAGGRFTVFSGGTGTDVILSLPVADPGATVHGRVSQVAGA